MKSPLIIANWKSHKTVKEIEEWFEEIASVAFASSSAKVVLCPPYPYLFLCKNLLQKHSLPWKIGAQDVSRFEEGKHTGEVNAHQLKDVVDYILIGHSERRQMGETDDILGQKVQQTLNVQLTPIYFVPEKNAPIPQGVTIVAYEPIFAIGTGHPDSPEDAEQVAHFIKETHNIPTVLYGGSVDDKNVSAFISCSSVDGIVPGTASLDPKEFSRLITHA